MIKILQKKCPNLKYSPDGKKRGGAGAASLGGPVTDRLYGAIPLS